MGTDFTSLSAISPLDGRYRAKLEDVYEYFSEYAIIQNRFIAEIWYFYFFVTQILHKKLSRSLIQQCVDSFNVQDAKRVKEIEKQTNHDVKAVEYFLREKLQSLHVEHVSYIHFGLTSEDLNSFAYGLALKNGKLKSIIPSLSEVLLTITSLAEQYVSIPMVAKTHGQVAVPTTVGKELIVFAMRIHHEFQTFKMLPIEGKITGAVGNYNAHVAGFPEVDWIEFCDTVVSFLGLTPNHFTTQIISADSSIKHFQSLMLINSILIGFSQDMWRYISDGCFIQNVKKGEVGSSTMPQKVNPIDFENAEGSLGLANSMFQFFSSKLPISRLQRDLSDSTVKRSIGSAVGYSIIGYKSIIQGLKKISVNTLQCDEELFKHWEIITEGIQTILRTNGDEKAYETMKDLTRGKTMTKNDIDECIGKLHIDRKTKNRIQQLSPVTYIGLAKQITLEGIKKIRKEELL